VATSEVVRSIVDALAFVYLVVAVNHEYLKAISYRDPVRLATIALGAALAWLHARRQRRLVEAEPRLALAFQLARPLLLVGAAWCAWNVIGLQNLTAAALAFLVLGFALADLAGAALARVLLAGTAGRRLALGGLAALLFVCARGLMATPPGTLRDEPAPPSGEGPPGNRPAAPGPALGSGPRAAERRGRRCRVRHGRRPRGEAPGPARPELLQLPPSAAGRRGRPSRGDRRGRVQVRPHRRGGAAAVRRGPGPRRDAGPGGERSGPAREAAGVARAMAAGR